MDKEIQKNLEVVRSVLTQRDLYTHAVRVLNYDEETICPEKAMEEQGELASFLSNRAYALTKESSFIQAVRALYSHRDELEGLDRVLIGHLYREDLQTRNISEKQDLAFRKVYSKAFVDWLAAKKQSDFSLYRNSLSRVRDAQLLDVSLREYEGERPSSPYNALLDGYERGVRTDDLDRAFRAFTERMTPLLSDIQKSGRKIRTDFLSRKVTDDQQKAMAEYLLGLCGFDFSRGAFTTTEHPFTDNLGRNDARVTTHYYPDCFASSMFSIIHEGGHALFMQLQPQEDYDHHLNDLQSNAMHESVSRFYENRIGRSRAFISLIYPKCREIFPQVFCDVSEEEFYEAINIAVPSLIRTEADEFTYTWHIIIRYELEKMLIDDDLPINDDLPKRWNDLYEKYLGVRPGTDREGILQDVHWADGFGYFQAYAIGNMYNAMYYNRMKEDIDIDAAVAAGRFDRINTWMKDHVFRKANYLAPGEWILDITGRAFTPDDFLDYLTEKYSAIYRL